VTKSEYSTTADDGKTTLWWQNGITRSQEEAQQASNRKRKAEQEALPLLAPIIEQASTRIKTADQLINEEATWKAKMAEAEMVTYHEAQALAQQVKTLVGDEEYARLESYRWHTYPRTVEYSASYWRQQLKRLETK
jgi:hypothetical protein